MKNIFIVILILCCHTAASQSENIDSLYNELRTHLQEDTTRVKLLILLGNVEQQNHNLADSFTLKALEISQKINWQMGVFIVADKWGHSF
nr:hypothetical protein [Bacteroidota bacterium]